MKDNNELWWFGPTVYKFHTADRALYDKISRWKNTRWGCTYSYPDGHHEWDLVIPARYYNRVARLAGLPQKPKHPNRVKAGRRNKGNLNNQQNSSG